MAKTGKEEPGDSAVLNNRYILTHRYSRHENEEAAAETRAAFDANYAKLVSAGSSVVHDSAKSPASEYRVRRAALVEGHLQGTMPKRQARTAATMVEQEKSRRVLRAHPNLNLGLDADHVPQPVGDGATLDFTLENDGQPLSGIPVSVYMANKYSGKTGSTTVSAVSDADGSISIPYDADEYAPSSVTVQPKSGYWMMVLNKEEITGNIEVPALPMDGPIGWWHRCAGVTEYDPTRGEGIKIGVIDTGCGKNPNLSHVTRIGSFINGVYNPDPSSTNDIEQHGTHVCGIIGARPKEGTGQYGGIAPGAEIYAARVFNKKTGKAGQGDIANAIEVLVEKYGVHLINLSLGGGESTIEEDLIQYAFERGTLCICAAGNGFGSPVDYPGAYPQTVAVSALSVSGAYPEGSYASFSIPSEATKHGYYNLSLAEYSDVGTQIICTAPGTGIISTVPPYTGHKVPYAEMEGTSMACPLATGATAAFLAIDSGFLDMPADINRAYHMYYAVTNRAVPLGMAPIYQGRGMAIG